MNDTDGISLRAAWIKALAAASAGVGSARIKPGIVERQHCIIWTVSRPLDAFVTP